MSITNDPPDVHDDHEMFAVDVLRGSSGPVVAVHGEFDLSAVEPVRRCIDGVRRSGRPLIVDLSGTTFIDSAGLKVLLEAYQAQGRNDEAVVLRNPSPAVRRIIDMTGICELIRVVEA